jgi:hypothetical protein
MNKAYLIEDYSEEGGVKYDYTAAIVFAPNGEEARQQANLLSYDADSEYINCNKAPEYDQYSELGYVPAKVYYDNGWNLLCAYCTANVSTTIDYEDCEEVDEDCYTYDPQFVDSLAYCCPSCKEEHTEDLLIRKQGLELFNSSFQNVEILDTYLTGNKALHVDFNFPGGSYKATWFSNNPTQANVVETDVEAWNKYRGKQ